MTGKVGGFGTSIVDSDKNDDTVTTDQIENYEHNIKFLGIPLIKITKYHKIDSKKVGKE